MCRTARVIGVGKERDPLARRLAIAAMKAAAHIGQSTKYQGVPNTRLIHRDELSTFRFHVKPDLFRSLQIYIEHLEQQVERLQLDAMFASREGNMIWLTGEDLKQKSQESFRARKDLIGSLFDGDS